jgi:predicted nucleotidyltransferase
MMINETLKEKRDEILNIASRYGARNVRVFGSIARGEGRRDSDLDVLVELEPGRSLLDIIAIKQDLEDLLNTKVDVVTEAAVSPYIRDQVLRQAISL